MKIYYKKSNGQWKLYEPYTNRLKEKHLRKLTCQHYLDENNSKAVEKKNLLDYLNECVIYLQEFRTDTVCNNIKANTCKKSVRILLNKKLWLSKYSDNPKICMSFSQFNDADELKSYQKPYFCIESSKITDLFTKSYEPNFINKLFCVFINIAPVHLILNSEYYPGNYLNKLIEDEQNKSDASFDLSEMEFSQEYSTIGKQLARFQIKGKQKCYDYLNHLWGKVIFHDEFVAFKYSVLLDG
jgi:hypothetical protein